MVLEGALILLWNAHSYGFATRTQKVSFATRTCEVIWVRTQRRRMGPMLVGGGVDLCAIDPKALAERRRNEGAHVFTRN